MDYIFLRVKGDVVIYVPRLISFMTTYVLLEQEDWFEKEIGFVRRILGPGMRVLDIGANFGVYTLAAAKLVGSEGAVWAFEPASVTAAYLRQSIKRNAFEWVTLRQLALSNRKGTAQLRLEENSELNTLSSEAAGRSEEVEITTLDQEDSTQSFGNIDFVKLDAEGEEINILAGGEQFFARQSPLIMFETKKGTSNNTGLQAAFQQRGYQLYRLIGPDWLLVPFGVGDTLDAFDLNLFACKADRASALANAGLLTEMQSRPENVAAGAGIDLLRRQRFAPAIDDPNHEIDPRYAEALDLYASWRDTNRPLGERYGALRASLAQIETVAEGSDNFAVLSSLARIAIEAGERQRAIQVMARLVDGLKDKPPKLAGPYWPASARFDNIDPGPAPFDWFRAALAESYEHQHAFSSYFVSPVTLPLLEWLQSTPFASAEMERRRQFMRIRARAQQGIVSTAILAGESPDNLNPMFWQGTA